MSNKNDLVQREQSVESNYDSDQETKNIELFYFMFDQKAISEDNRLKEINKLLINGADIDAVCKNKRDNTILHEAVRKKFHNIVKFLVEKGAKINIKNRDGKTPLDLAEQNKDLITLVTKSINVPGDGSCLFWAVTLAYLTSIQNDEHLFKERFEKLFGKENLENLSKVKKEIHYYNPFENRMEISDELKNLVTKIFREKVIQYIESKKDHFIQFYQNESYAFEEYLQKMKDPYEWGGELEIDAIAKMIGCKIIVNSEIVTYYGNENHDRIELYHENFSSNGLNVNNGNSNRNHYNFAVDVNLIDDYQRKRKQESRDTYMSSMSTPINTKIKRKLSTDSSCDDDKDTAKKITKTPLQIETSIAKSNSTTNFSDQNKKSLEKDNLEKLNNYDYPSGGLKRSLHGIIYQLKILTLFLQRANYHHINFNLATEMDAAEKFDDLVIHYLLDGKITTRVLQAKHKQDNSIKITYQDLSTSNTDREFCLIKYFMSFLKIKKNSISDKGGLIKDVDIKEYTIFTNIDLNMVDLKNNNIDFEKIEDDDILKLNMGQRYKLKVKNEKLIQLLKDSSSFKVLANELIRHLNFEGNFKDSTGLTLNIDIFKDYHSALIEEKVIQINENGFGSFHENFVNYKSTHLIDSDLSEPAKRLGQLLEKNLGEKFNMDLKFKLSKTFGKGFRFTNIGKFSQDLASLIKNNKTGTDIILEKINKNEIEKLAGYVLVKQDEKLKFSSKFFNLDTKLPGDLELLRTKLKKQLEIEDINFNSLNKYNFTTDQLGDFEDEEYCLKSKLPEDYEIDANQIELFFEKLIFAVNQPNEINLDDIIKKAIGVELNLIHTDLHSSFLIVEVLNWLKQKRGTFFSKNEWQEKLNELKQKCSQLILTNHVLNYKDTYEKLGIKFSKQSMLIINNCFSTSQKKQIFNIETKSTTLSAIKCHQALKSIDTYKKDDSYIFDTLESVLLMSESVLYSFKSTSKLIIIENKTDTPKDIKISKNKLFEDLFNIIKKDEEKKLIILGYDNDLDELIKKYGLESKYTKEEDFNLNFNHMILESQEKLLTESKVLFQGVEIYLNEIINQNDTKLKSLIDLETLIKLIEGNKVTIGKKPKYLDEVKNYYITRELCYDSESLSEDKLLSQNKCSQVIPKILIISDMPGMGKSTVISSLAQKFKNKNPNIWVDKICLHDYCSQLYDFKSKYPNLNNANKMNFLDFISNDILDLESSFEKEIFKNRLNKTVLFFDGFDEIYPYYSDVVVNLIKNLIDNQEIQLWISTRFNMSEFLKKELKNHDEYILKPFSDQNQVNFLIKFWKYNNSEKSETFAEFLIDTFSSSINDRTNFTSIPMLLKMLGQIFQNEETEDEFENMKLKNLNHLYERFIQKIFKEHYLRDKKNRNFHQPNEKTLAEENLKNQVEKHEFLALHSLFNENDLKLLISNQEINNVENWIEQIEKKELESEFIIKILKFKNFNKVQFLHSTFAEYFIKNYFVKILNENLNKKTEFFISNILIKPLYKFIRALIENQLKDTKLSVLKIPYNKSQLMKNKRNFFHIAAIEGNLEIAKLLINLLENPTYFLNQKDVNNNNVLHLAVEHGRLKVVKWLIKEQNFKNKIDEKNNNGYTVLHLAVERGRLNVVKWLIKEQNFKNKIDEKNNNGYTAIHLAVKNDSIDVFKLIIDQDANLLATDLNDNNVLHLAAEFDKKNIAKFILNIEIFEINKKNNKGLMALHIAAAKGSFNVIELLLEKESDVDIKDNANMTALQHAMNSNYKFKWKVIDKLIKKGANINVKNNNGKIFLDFAADRGKWDIIETLFKERTTIFSKDESYKYTVLFKASENSDKKMIEMLLEKGAKLMDVDIDENNILHIAAKNKNLQLVNWLITEKNFISKINEKNKNGLTALHLASENGHIEVVKRLIDNGADINSKDSMDQTPLHLAAKNGNMNVFELLVNKKANIFAADLNANNVLHLAAEYGRLNVVEWLIKEPTLNDKIDKKNNNGYTALHLASKNGKKKIVSSLISYKADVDIKCNNNKTALQLAMASNSKFRFCIVKNLIKHNANPKVKDENGKNILHLAIENGNLNLVKFLVDKIDDLEIKDNNNYTALQCAMVLKAKSKWKIINILFKKNVDIKVTDKSLKTILHLAAESGNLNIIKSLVIEKKAKIDVKDCDGKTPLDLAKIKNHPRCIQFLKKFS